MSETIHFHTDLYRRAALERAAERLRAEARVELDERAGHVIAHLEPLDTGRDARNLRDEFCHDAFSETARQLRDGAPNGAGAAGAGVVESDAPPWHLLSPVSEGEELGLGWFLESLSPVRSGAATMVLRHGDLGNASVAIRRNGGAPLGVAYTDQLDFMLMNGGGGSAKTEESVGRVLGALAEALRYNAEGGPDDAANAGLLAHSEARPAGQGAAAARPLPRAGKRVAPNIDPDNWVISFELDDAGVSRLAVYDAVLTYADRGYVFLTRPTPTRIAVHIRARGQQSTDELRSLAADLTRTLNRVVRNGVETPGPVVEERRREQRPPAPKRVDLDALLAELEAADAATLGIGFEAERGPGHDNLRILNIRGTGACNSDCVWCVEKFDPTHRSMPKADTTRQFILDGANQFDMLFFASGEPTIHPKLFEYVEAAKSVGFTSFGMSSHFRALANPRVTLKVLQAGFQYFDISLHAADRASQLAVNPIDDGGESLFEALKGLAVLYRLADALGIRISVTHKIVVSRLNATRLEEVFFATYDRGVRHFILQPVRAMNLEPDRQALTDMPEEEILPHLNELLRRTQGLGATVKPYGFSRQGLFEGGHIEYEQNRLKNVFGKVRGPGRYKPLQTEQEQRAPGQHWVELRRKDEDRCGFAVDVDKPILDQALTKGLELPFGCRMGSCGMCCARLLSGTVDQSTQIFLTEEQERAGYVLLCQARPLSDVTIDLVEEDELDPL